MLESVSDALELMFVLRVVLKNERFGWAGPAETVGAGLRLGGAQALREAEL